MRAAAPLLWVLAACNGPETNFQTLAPGLAVAPDRVDFGKVGPPLSGAEQLFVTNSGKRDLEFSATIEGGEGTVVMEQGDFVLGPAEEMVFDLTFRPATFKRYSGRVRIQSNDENNPFEFVPFYGEGVDLPFPDIHISPAQTVEVVDVPTTAEGFLTFQIENVGGATLELGDLAIDGPTSFSMATDPSGGTVVAGGSQTVLVRYQAPHELGEEATLTIPSNDPDEPETTVVLLANGGGERPVAVINCPSQVLLSGPEVIQLDGSGSYDPQNLLPLAYLWEVTDRPEGSDRGVPLDPDDLRQVDLYLDIAGRWEVELRVVNALGTSSEPAVCAFDAIPEDDLRVELSWDTSAADVDLHLARAGAGIFQRPDDCNYCNPNPDWGANGDADDPRLDIDDRGGFGPENINIESPEAGAYDVRVHYYQRNGDGPVIATVQVWLFGAEVWSGQRVLLHDEVWDVGVVDMPSGLFVEGVVPNYESPRRGCTN